MQMKYSNNLSLPEPLVKAITAGDGSRPPEPNVRRTTQLIDAPWRYKLFAKHYDEIKVDVSDRIWSIMGQIGHSVLENVECKDYQQEVSMQKEIDGMTITGTADLIYNNSIYDFKFTTIYKQEGCKEWDDQLNVYRWLYGEDKIQNLYIVAIFRDWSKTKAYSSNVPSTQVKLIKIPVYNDAERFVKACVKLHQNPRPDVCTPEERWAKPDCWAMYRNKAKSKADNPRAYKLYYNEAEAVEYLKLAKINCPKDDWTLEFRQGEDTRCMDYCDVSQFCEYYKNTYLT